MNLSEQDRQAIVENRVKKAFETWEETQAIIREKLWYAAANRLYYACYYMTSALLVQNGYETSTHTGTIRLFGKHFVSKGIVSNATGRFYSKLFELRQAGDYDDWKIVNAEIILPLVEPAKEYLHLLHTLIEKDNS